MDSTQQLIKRDFQNGGYRNIFPKNYTENIRDKETGEFLDVSLAKVNFLFLPYHISPEHTRLQVPESRRRLGLWISYIIPNEHRLVIEYYLSDNIEDSYWSNDAYWFDTNGNIVDPDIASAVEQIREYVDDKTLLNSEDLNRNENHEIQFSDKDYNPTEFSGLGRVYLRKNISNGKNVLTQDMINKPNTRYIIQYDYDLNGQTITIPEGCTLDFQGGSFSNGTVNFNNTFINSKISCVLPDTCKGELTNETIYPEWFTTKEDYSEAIQTSINVASKTSAVILFTKDKYLVRGGTLLFKSNLTFKSYNKSIIYTKDSETYNSIFYSDPNKSSDNVTFDGIVFDQSAQEQTQIIGKHAEMYCILTYKSINLTVKNCKFINVGTNCVVCNGSSCHNTQILNNYFYFIRNKSIDNYDNSVVYISDSLHRIEGNIIANDGTPENRSRGGIETHGYCGTVRNNIISNCNNAINIVSVDEDYLEGIEADRLITGNICYNCTCFCNFWIETKFHDIENVVISNNIASNIVNAVKTTLGTAEQGNIKNINICNNYFVGRYKEIVDKISTDEYYEAAFALFSYGNATNVRIHNNTLVDFPKMLVSTNPYGKLSGGPEWVQEIYFTNNSCINCLNSSIKEGVTIDMYYALFFVGIYTNMVVEDNTISIPNDRNRNAPIYIFRTSPYGIVGFKYSNNIIKGQNSINYHLGVSSDESKIYVDFINNTDSKKIYNENNVGTNYLNPNDIIITDGPIYVITEGGHFTTDISYTGTLTLKYLYVTVGLLTGDSFDNIQIGDNLQLKLPNKEFVATVVEKIQSGLYIKSNSLQPNAQGTLSWLKYKKAEMNVYTKAKVYTESSKPVGVTGDIGYNSTTGRVTIYTGTKWTDSDGLPDVILKGNTAQRPTLTLADAGTKYYDTSLGEYIYWNGTKWTDAQGFTPLAHKGVTAQIPSKEDGLVALDYGFLFYNYDERKLRVWDSVQWTNVDGTPLGMGIDRGSTAGRPTLDSTNVGYMYFDSVLNKMILWSYDGWVNMDGSSLEAGPLEKGTTAQRPTTLTSSNNGFRYFDVTLKRPIYWMNTGWVDADGYTPVMKQGSSSSRPTFDNNNTNVGFRYFDTSLGKPIFWTGTKWVDATGADV